MNEPSPVPSSYGTALEALAEARLWSDSPQTLEALDDVRMRVGWLQRSLRPSHRALSEVVTLWEYLPESVATFATAARAELDAAGNEARAALLLHAEGPSSARTD
jgi:hypothetical protein